MRPQPESDDRQRLWRQADAATLERRFFSRTNVSANGELVWATKKMFGRVSTHREFLVTENLSRDGAKVLLNDTHHFPVGTGRASRRSQRLSRRASSVICFFVAAHPQIGHAARS